MSDYDKSQDKVLWAKDDVFKDSYSRLSVDIYKYGDKGKPKLQITREKYDKEKDDWIIAKLGRMTYEEFVAVAKAAKEGFAAGENAAPQGRQPEGWGK